MFLQMVLVLEGLAALCAFELAVAGRLVEQLVLQEKRRKRRVVQGEKATATAGGESLLNNHNRSA